MNRPTRTSYSALSTWQACPASYKYAYIDHLADESGEAAKRGSRLHLALEKYLKGSLPFDRLPVDFWRVKEDIGKLKLWKSKSEQTWCVNRDWKICKEDDPDVWFKAIIDVHYFPDKEILSLIDLKTGKIYPEHTDQLQLYATIGFRKYPKAKSIHVSGLYADIGRYDTHAHYQRSMEKHLIQYWDAAAKSLMADEIFPMRPSESNCRYCNFSKARGGPCPGFNAGK